MVCYVWYTTYMSFCDYYQRKEFSVMHRFFAEPSQINDNSIVITGDDVNHISRVLRLKCGDEIEVCDKNNTDFICSISEISKTEVVAEILKTTENKNESPIDITLYQGIPKGDKMDDIIKKCVELGVKKIVPVVMKRTVVKVKSPYPKTGRWERIISEASKQCRRGIIPALSEPIDFDKMIEILSDSDGVNILPYENEDKTSLKEVLKENKAKEINIIIGPEGGFDDEEIIKARQNNFSTVTLGPRIMRCETAPIAAVSAVMYECGDW